MKTLKKLRHEYGLKQNSVAVRIGVSTDTIRRWERGQTQPSATQAIELAKLYEVAVDEVEWVTVRTADPKDQTLHILEA